MTRVCQLFIAVVALTLGGSAVALHPEYPVVEGEVQLTSDWSLFLDQPHNRRSEDGSLVLWRPKFTIWINVCGNDHRESVESRLEWIKSESSPDAFDIVSEHKDCCFLHAYRLTEDRQDGTVHSYNGYVVAPNGHVQISIYFDDPGEAGLAAAVVESVRWESDVQ